MTLFGYGKTTKAIADRFGNCKVYDDKFTAFSSDKYGNEFYPSEDFKPQTSQLEVTSPGIAPSHPLIISAKNLISEYDLFAKKMPVSIWVSGTNGKTTTTQMIGALLEDIGAKLGGNIGNPLAKLDEDAPLWILETSSFTLHYTNIAKPNIYILLPITPDHISWHGSFEAYEEAKLKPLAMMEEGSIAIIPKKYAKTMSLATIIGYESALDLADEFGIELEKLSFEEPFLTDATLALSVQKILFDKLDYEKINSFKIGEHRVERFLDQKGRVWINDSKATNPDATIAALKSFKDKQLFLILGGDDKGADQRELFEFLRGLNVTIFTIGKNEKSLNDLAKEFKITTKPCTTLEKAIKEIDPLHSKNSIAILSPAAASLDQFESYAKRGEEFKERVLTINRAN